MGIDERVGTVGVNSAGVIYPANGETAWFTKSVRPGRPGISVIVGHVVGPVGPDVFYNLAGVHTGATITLDCADGKSLRLTVTSKASETKTAATHDARIWGTSSTPVVAIITCDRNSPLDSSGAHYTNNYIVWATPSA